MASPVPASGAPFLLSGLDCIGERVAVRSGGRLQPGYVLDFVEPSSSSAGGVCIELDAGGNMNVELSEATTKIVHWNEPDRSLSPIDRRESGPTDEAVLRELQEQQEREEAWLRSRLPRDGPKSAPIWEGRRTVAFAASEPVIVPQPAAPPAMAAVEAAPPTHAAFTVPVRVGVTADALLLHASACSGCDVGVLRASRVARDDSRALLRNQVSALLVKRSETFESGQARLGDWPVAAQRDSRGPAVARVDWDSPASGTLVPSATALEIDDGGAAGEVMLLTLMGRRQQQQQPKSSRSRSRQTDSALPPAAKLAPQRPRSASGPRKALASAALRFRDVLSLLAWRHRQTHMLQNSPASAVADTLRFPDQSGSELSGMSPGTHVAVWVPVFAAKHCAGGAPADGSMARSASWIVEDGSAAFEAGPWRLVQGVARQTKNKTKQMTSSPCGFVRVSFSAVLEGSQPDKRGGLSASSVSRDSRRRAGGGGESMKTVILPASPSGVRLLPAMSAAGVEMASATGRPRTSTGRLPRHMSKSGGHGATHTRRSNARSHPMGVGLESSLEVSALEMSDDAEVSFAVSEIGTSAQELELPALGKRSAGAGRTGPMFTASLIASSPRSSDGTSGSDRGQPWPQQQDQQQQQRQGVVGGFDSRSRIEDTSAAARAERADESLHTNKTQDHAEETKSGNGRADQLPAEWNSRDRARWRRVVRAAEAAGEEAGPGLRPAAIYGQEQRLDRPRLLQRPHPHQPHSLHQEHQSAGRPPRSGVHNRLPDKKHVLKPQTKRLYEAEVPRSPAVAAERADPRAVEDARLADATSEELSARFGLDTAGDDLAEAVSRLRARVWEGKERVGTLRVATRRTEAALRSNTALMRRAAAGRLASAHVPSSASSGHSYPSGAWSSSSSASSRVQGSVVADAAVQLRRFRTAATGESDSASLFLGAAGEEDALWMLPTAVAKRSVATAAPTGQTERIRIERLQALCARQHSKLREVVVARGSAAASYLTAKQQLEGLEDKKKRVSARLGAVRRRQLWRTHVPEATEAAERALGRAAARAALHAGHESVSDRSYALNAATAEPLSASSRAELVTALARLSTAERSFVLAGMGSVVTAPTAASPAVRIAGAVDELVAEQQRLDLMEARLAELSTEAVAVESRAQVLHQREATREERWEKQRSRLQLVIEQASAASEQGGDSASDASHRLSQAQARANELRRLVDDFRTTNTMAYHRQP